MDPMIDFVRGRTSDLQRIAEDLHLERDLRHMETASMATTPATVTAPRRLEPLPASELACEPCHPTTAARPAA
jgi:hypothetical protein